MSESQGNTNQSISSDLDLPLLGTIVIVSALLILAVVMGIMAMYHNVYQQQKAMNDPGVTNKWLIDNQAGQIRLLDAAGVYDSAAGYFNVPIDRAMQKYIDTTIATDGAGPQPPEAMTPGENPVDTAPAEADQPDS